MILNTESYRKLGRVFASGNLPRAHEAFVNEHYCNQFCAHYKAPSLATLTPSINEDGPERDDVAASKGGGGSGHFNAATGGSELMKLGGVWTNLPRRSTFQTYPLQLRDLHHSSLSRTRRPLPYPFSLTTCLPQSTLKDGERETSQCHVDGRGNVI